MNEDALTRTSTQRFEYERITKWSSQASKEDASEPQCRQADTIFKNVTDNYKLIALDVKDDVQLIDQHQEYQINVCPEIEKSIKELCIQKLKI